MSLPEGWASPEDFATLFKYLWHRDFPVDLRATGARRTDWTIHIGVVVRTIADLMGLVTRFEAGSRKDAVLRSTEGDEVAIEWEWSGVWRANELEKLKQHEVRPKGKERLKYAVLITYTHPPNIQNVYKHVMGKWEGARWPLLLILIDLIESKKYHMGKEFNNIQMSIFNEGEKVECRELRSAPAFPWEVPRTRWSYELKDEK